MPADSRSDLVVAANRLPVHQSASDQRWTTSPGGLVTSLSPVLARYRSSWIGWSGVSGPVPDRLPAEDFDLIPIGLDELEVETYYEGMANSTLWPLYHGAQHQPVIDPDWWDVYTVVNRRFAETAAAAVAPDGCVWVHDYHLQLVPQMLRPLRNDISIAFFCHTPFPSRELFRRLPWREELIRGILGADTVGFQTSGDVDNFMSVCVGLLPDIEISTKRSEHLIVSAGRSTRVGAHPISIDVAEVESQAGRPDVLRAARLVRTRMGSPRTLLLGVDRLDYTKGIDARLDAFASLLTDGVLDPSEVAFIQVASPSREQVDGYLSTRRRIERQVSEINGDFARIGRPVVAYLHQTFEFAELLPLYLAADVMVVTPYRDGMNLVAKEYVACRRDDTGSLVLSEFAGAAVELSAAHLCNPFDRRGLARVIADAIHEPVDERVERMRLLRAAVHRNDVHRWAADVLGAHLATRLSSKPTSATSAST